ncbi:MAG: hypothetical protein P1U42_00835 [Phycisphaerales bacterium]|nr:hypothetical protein [Phycisphaerales bacterium]
MIGKASPARREGLIRSCHKLIDKDKEGFTLAGQRLGEMYSEEYARSYESTPDNPQARQLLFIRIDLAKCAVISGDHRPGMTDMLFDEPMPKEDRKHAARLVVLALLLAMDPMDDDCVSTEMCPLAALPWECGDFDGKNPDFLGRSFISWVPGEENSVNSPPAEVLDLLERAMYSARTGEVWEPWLEIRSGDGMPINEPGTNKFDELARSMCEVARYVEVFQSNAKMWADAQKFELGDELIETENRLLEYNRVWWEKWESVIRRAHAACFAVQRPELQVRIQIALEGITRLANIFSQPLMGTRGEQPGDHLFRRGPLSCDLHGVSKYPQTSVDEARKHIWTLIESLGLYLDGTLVEVYPDDRKQEGIKNQAPNTTDLLQETKGPDSQWMTNVLCKHLGRDKTTVRKWAKHADIAIRKRGQAYSFQELRLLSDSALTLNDHVSAQTIIEIVQKTTQPISHLG